MMLIIVGSIVGMILLIYGLEDVLQYVVNAIDFNGSDIIRDVLLVGPNKMLKIDIYSRISY